MSPATCSPFLLLHVLWLDAWVRTSHCPAHASLGHDVGCPLPELHTLPRPALPCPAVAEEEQKKEVKRGVYSMLRRGVTRSEKAVLRPSPSKAALAKEAAAEADAAAGTVQIKSVVPFVPISLVCKNIRWVCACVCFCVRACVVHMLVSRITCVFQSEMGWLPAAWSTAVCVRVCLLVHVCPIWLSDLLSCLAAWMVLPGLYCRYFVNDPSGGTAPGVVKDSEDKEIAGKLELLKVGALLHCTALHKEGGISCKHAFANTAVRISQPSIYPLADASVD